MQVEQTRSGAEFARLYDQTYRRLVLLACATTGSQALAEELVQDAFLQLLDRWTEVTAKEAWLRRAVISLSTSWLRRYLTQRRLEEFPVVSQEQAPDSVVHLRLLLADLTPRQRAAVVLKYYEDLSEQQIAETLGCRPGTVKSLLSRSMTKLRKDMTDAQQS
jgi:RNA polymerase sigma-70 factor (sigma-E family)